LLPFIVSKAPPAKELVTALIEVYEYLTVTVLIFDGIEIN
jgi:hypothetical protein